MALREPTLAVIENRDEVRAELVASPDEDPQTFSLLLSPVQAFTRALEVAELAVDEARAMTEGRITSKALFRRISNASRHSTIAAPASTPCH